MRVTRLLPFLSALILTITLVNCTSTKPTPEGDGKTGNTPPPTITQKQIPDTDKAQLLQDVRICLRVGTK